MARTVYGQSTPPASTEPIAKPADDTQGHTFGRYRLLEKLGKGGMGVVWKAYDTQLKRVVALKQIRPGEEDAETAERFVREAQAAARLRHPNIVAVHEAGVIDGHHYLTTEYVDAKTLRDVMGAQPLVPKNWQGQLAGAIELVKQVAEGLAYAHGQGIIHRDVKPENILVDAHGKAFVMDFGLAKDLRQELGRNLTLSGSALGTPPYMSPEQARGWKEAMGPPTDQFSLGVVLYELLTGKLPFDGTSWPDLSTAIVEKDPVRPTRLNPRLHRDLETICLKALEKDPQRRYESMAALAADLGRWLEGEPIAARPVSIAERLWRRASRHRRVVVPIAALALAALLGLGWAVAASVRKAEDVAKALARGRDAEAAGNLEGAREAYTAAEALAPSREEAKAGRSRVEARLWERAEARAADEQQAERLLEDGGHALELAQRSLYDPKANYEDLKKRVDVGKKLIEEAIGKAPEKARGHDLLGRAWKLLGWEEKAEDCWREAIRLDPKFGPAHLHLGMLFLDRALVAKTLTVQGESKEERDGRAAVMLADAKKELALVDESSWAGEDEVSKELLRVATAYVAKERQRVLELAAAAVERFGDREGCERFHVLEYCSGEDGALDRALRVCPRDALAVMLRGLARAHKADLDGAIADFNQAIAINPRWAMAFYSRGVAREAKGEHDGAIADYDQAIAINPRYEDAFVNRAALRSHKQDLDGAIADADRALAINPRSAEAFNNRGNARGAKGNLDGAIADYDQAIAINPRYAEAFYNRGIARKDKSDIDGAIADFDQALTLNPRYAEAFYNRGIARVAKGDLDGAIADWDHAIAIKPRFAEAFVNRGVARVAKGERDGAIADYDQAIAINPRYAEAFYNRGLARQDKSDIDGAIADYDQTIAINPRFADAFRNRGMAREAKGERDGAIADYDQAIAIDPRSAEAFNNRGNARGAKGNLDGAIADFDEVLRIDPKNQGAHYNLACIHSLRSVGKAGAKPEEQAVSPQDASRHRDSAFDHLSKAIDLGFSEGTHLRDDTDLAPLHDDPRWKELLKRLSK